MKKYYAFSSLFIEVFTREITDTNLLVRFLKLNIYYPYLDKKDILEFIKILKKRYTEKQILALFVELCRSSNTGFFKDMIDAILDVDDLFKKNKKIKCTVQSLHDAATKHRRKLFLKKLFNTKLHNEKHKLKACVDIDDYAIKLPQNGPELHEWAETLHNCMDGYLDMIINNETIIYGFFTCKQKASRVCNQDLLPHQQIVLKRWLNRYFPQEKIINVA